MGTTQINFRIDEELLAQIKERAKSEGIPYTVWILSRCKAGLGIQPDKSSDVYQSSSSLDKINEMLDERIAEVLGDVPTREELTSAIASLQSELQDLKKLTA